MSVVDEILAELCAAELAAHRVARVRVTPHALPGSAVATPIMRRILTWQNCWGVTVDDSVTNAEEHWVPTEWYELLVHPDDWLDVVGEVFMAAWRYGKRDAQMAKGPLVFMGLEVVYDS